jgi:hypothetical protein
MLPSISRKTSAATFKGLFRQRFLQVTNPVLTEGTQYASATQAVLLISLLSISSHISAFCSQSGASLAAISLKQVTTGEHACGNPLCEETDFSPVWQFSH